jgi:hypothetical protein
VGFFRLVHPAFGRALVLSRGCCCQTKSCGSRAAETEKQGKMSLRLSEAISAEASCSAGVGFFIRVHPVFCRAPCSPEAAAAKLNLVEAEQQREKQGKMSLRSSEAISAQASCSEGVDFFMRVHPVFGRAPFSPDAAAAKLNRVEAEQQRRRSGGRCRAAQQKSSPPRRAVRLA